ncbi:MAG: hypothetical protein ACD_75C00536G0002 [uncultured bacterium]|nr:MAG: hypothetical protein ACD_75C00536G0002 [uncultured bacterium]
MFGAGNLLVLSLKAVAFAFCPHTSANLQDTRRQQLPALRAAKSFTFADSAICLVICSCASLPQT